MPKKIESLSDLTPDPENANQGTARGLSAVESSLEHYGAGRSIVTDRDGIVLAGNKTHERAVDMGFKARVVETEGDELVVVVRKDLSLKDDPAKARGLAYADNRVSELGLNWNPDQIQKDLAEGFQHMPVMFTEEEIAERLGQAPKTETDDTPATAPTGNEHMTFSVDADQSKVIRAAIKKAKEQPHAKEAKITNGQALSDICAAYVYGVKADAD